MQNQLRTVKSQLPEKTSRRKHSYVLLRKRLLSTEMRLGARSRLDLVARQNIQDFNTHLYLYPAKSVRFWLQYHHFELANDHDALYNASGKPIARDPTGAAGSNVGDELDYIINFHLSATSDLLMGYSHLFLGEFLIRTGTRTPSDQVFVQYSLRF